MKVGIPEFLKVGIPEIVIPDSLTLNLSAKLVILTTSCELPIPKLTVLADVEPVKSG